MIDLFMGALLVFGTLAVISVIGHGIWLLVTAIFNQSRRVLEPATPPPSCPKCGGSTHFQGGLCGKCGYQVPTVDHADLEAAINQLDRLMQLGRIRVEHYAAARRALQAEQQELARTVTRPAQADTPQVAEPVDPGKPIVEPAGRSAFYPLADSPFATSAAASMDQSELVEAEVVEPEAAKSAHPLDADEPAPAERPRFSARPALADVLQAFMEEKNIRWGELASGILIVGSAIGLIVSLRATLAQLSEQVPYFPALLFMLGTAAIHGAGLYTLRRWNLRSTSRGVLIIAMLLVPLSFAAGIILSGQGSTRISPTSPIYILSVMIGIVGYGTITSLSAHALTPRGWWAMVAAVMLPSIGQLVINRLATAQPNWPPMLLVTVLFGLPTAGYLAATFSQFTGIIARRRLTPAHALQTLTTLGIAAFSLSVPLVLLLWLRPDRRLTLAELSPLLGVAASLVVGLGLAIHRRCLSRAMAATGTIGTGLAVFGTILMLGTIATAWPRPDILVAVGTVIALTLSSAAMLGSLPVLLAGAIAAATLAFWVSIYWATGLLTPGTETTGHELISVLLRGRSSVVLLAPLAGTLLGSILAQRARRRPESMVYMATAAGLAALATGIALYAGFVSGIDADWTTPVLALAAIGVMAASVVLRRPSVSWIGSGLVFLFLLHFLGYNHTVAQWLTAWQLLPTRPLLVSALTHGLLIELLAGLLALRDWRSGNALPRVTTRLPADSVASVLLGTGLLSTGISLPTVLGVTNSAFAIHAGYMLVISAAWLIAGLLTRNRLLLTATHIIATVAIVLATLAIAASRWDTVTPWFQQEYWLVQLTVLGLWCAASSATRIGLQRRLQVKTLLRSNRPEPDQLLLGGLVVALLGLGVITCFPQAILELGFASVNLGSPWDGWHLTASQPGTWLALGCILLALTVAIGERRSPPAFAGLTAATAFIPLMVSGSLQSQHAVASGLRWSLSGYFITWAILLSVDRPILALARRRWRLIDFDPEPHRSWVQVTSFLWGFLPVVALTGLALLQLIQHRVFGGPSLDSWFGQLGTSYLYGVPLAALVLALLVMATSDRQPALAMLGALVFQWLVSLAVIVPAIQQGGPWTEIQSADLLRWNAVGLVGFAAIWLALARWISTDKSEIGRRLWTIQMGLAMAAVLAIPTWVVCATLLDPTRIGRAVLLVSSWPGFAAAVGWTAITIWHFRNRRIAQFHSAIASALVVTTLGSVQVVQYVTRFPWPAYHTLVATWLWLGWSLVLVGVWQSYRTSSRNASQTVCRWSAAIASAVTILALRTYTSSPLNPLWAILVCLGIGLLFVALGLLARKTWYAYGSLPLAILVATGIWNGYKPWSAGYFDFLFLNLQAAILMAFLWLLVEIWYQDRHQQSLDEDFRGPRVHVFVARVASFAIWVLAACLFAGGLVETAYGLPRNTLATPHGIGALLGITALWFTMFWDGRARRVAPALYVCGLTAFAYGLHRAQCQNWLDGEQTIVWLLGLVAGWGALTGHLWARRGTLMRWAQQLRMKRPMQQLQRTSIWLPVTNLLLTLPICALGILVVLTFRERSVRVASALGPLFSAYGIACLARSSTRDRLRLQTLSLLLVSLAAVFVGLSETNTGGSQQLAMLQYAVQLVIVLAVMIIFYGVVVARWLGVTSLWYTAVRKTAGLLAIGAVVVLGLILIVETALFRPGVGVALETPQVIAVSVMLVGLVVALLSMAMLPGNDPWNLTEKGRTVYVYAAQLTAALLLAHIYLTKPQLFSEFFRPYWPYLVMLVAFASVGVGELFQRLGWRVLSEPFQRTGGFLPLIPMLGIWLVTSDSDYTLVLFFAGLLYMMLAIARRSLVHALLAAVVGNGAFWSLLHDTGISLLAQPQFWLIPPAVSALVAAQVNRHRLTEAQLTAIRYISVLVIYLSSSGEMFMKMLAPAGDTEWLRPMILTGLAVAGIFLGILLQIRAFLYLGISFLTLSIIAMVWNAARLVEHTWPWWAFGISLGIIILTLFGIFEKRRSETLQLVQRLRQWEP